MTSAARSILAGGRVINLPKREPEPVAPDVLKQLSEAVATMQSQIEQVNQALEDEKQRREESESKLQQALQSLESVASRPIPAPVVHYDVEKVRPIVEEAMQSHGQRVDSLSEAMQRIAMAVASLDTKVSAATKERPQPKAKPAGKIVFDVIKDGAGNITRIEAKRGA